MLYICNLSLNDDCYYYHISNKLLLSEVFALFHTVSAIVFYWCDSSKSIAIVVLLP